MKRRVGENALAIVGELSEDLKSVIDRYLDGHRGRSLATLSRASGVSYTTIRRFSQREGNPTAEPVLKIVDAALGRDEKIAFIDRHFPEIARTIARFEIKDYPQEEGPDGGERGETLKSVYSRYPHGYVMNLALMRDGVSAKTVERLFGEKGLEALDEIELQDLVEKRYVGGEAVYQARTWISVDCDMALSQVKLSADIFDRSMIGTKAARLFHATASVSAEALERIHGIVTKAVTEIAEVKDDPRNAGDIPFFVDMMMNLYDKAPLLRAQESNDVEV